LAKSFSERSATLTSIIKLVLNASLSYSQEKGPFVVLLCGPHDGASKVRIGAKIDPSPIHTYTVQEVRTCSLLGCPILFMWFFGLDYKGEDIVFRFIIECSSLMDFGP